MLFLVFVLTAARQWGAVAAALKNRKVLATLFLTACLNSLNWGVYIFAVVSDQLLAASLGYFLNPLVNVLLGFLFLRERLSRMQQVAVALAAVGVAIQIIGFGQLPWIALTIAFAFGIYGLLRKTVDAGAPVGLFVECLLVSPVALGFLIWLDLQAPRRVRAVQPRTGPVDHLGGPRDRCAVDPLRRPAPAGSGLRP